MDRSPTEYGGPGRLETTLATTSNIGNNVNRRQTDVTPSFPTTTAASHSSEKQLKLRLESAPQGRRQLQLSFPKIGCLQFIAQLSPPHSHRFTIFFQK